MSQNAVLNRARSAPKDEYFTQLVDIENELKHYKKHFKGKTVYCNCDDPWVSNFFHYFSYNFEHLGLKRLITTCYKNQNPDLFSQHDKEQAIWLEYKGDLNGNKIPDPEEIGVYPLQGDGDFRSNECVNLLLEADIVVTNPPFSLFHEFVAQLVEKGKKFLIIGDQNKIGSKEVFNLIKTNKLWLGVDNGGTKWFEVRDDYEIETESRKKTVNGKKYFSKGNINWFTNLEHDRRNEEIDLDRRFSPEEYPRYDNYDVIEVGTYKDIPMDYDGAMAVPITFLAKHNPNQFEILDANDFIIDGRAPLKPHGLIKDKHGTIPGYPRPKYVRFVIRNKRL